VRFTTFSSSFDGVLKYSPVVAALLKSLPLTSTVQRWGDEIYFDVPVKMANAKPTVEVEVGDIAFWPEGPCLCIFFGKTPASLGREPRPASEVTIIGHTEAPAELLRTVKAGTAIRVEPCA
jgi:hypothetical protein